jgi:hypothetical protein
MVCRYDLVWAVLSAPGRVQPTNPIIGEGSDGGKRPATDDPQQPDEVQRS